MASPVVFKRWSRRPWAAFASLHRVVLIGVVKTSIADAQMLKMRRRFRLALFPDPRLRFGEGDDEASDSPPPPDSLLAGLLSSICVPAASRGGECRPFAFMSEFYSIQHPRQELSPERRPARVSLFSSPTTIKKST